MYLVLFSAIDDDDFEAQPNFFQPVFSLLKSSGDDKTDPSSSLPWFGRHANLERDFQFIASTTELVLSRKPR